MYDINHMPGVIELGRTGENRFRPIQIDMKPWLDILPDGVPSIIHIRPGETSAESYIAATTFEDGILTWQPVSADLGQVEGYGQMSVWFEQEDTGENRRGKSVNVQTFVRGSIGPAEADPPEPQESWLEQMTELKTATVNAKGAAEAAQAGAEAAQEAAGASATAAAGSAADAAGSAAAAAGSAAQAAETATDVAGYVAAAEGYATDAAASATAAAGSATAAEGSATAAAGSATTAAGKATEAATAKTAAETAQAAAEAAQAAAEDARDKYPIIDATTGNWMVWDAEEEEYADTGIKARPDAVRVQDTQPTDEDSMIWFPETAPASVQVPTVAEMNAALAAKYEKPSGGIPATDIAAGVIPDVSGLYTKPVTGIPATDMDSAVQTSLDAADTAYQKPAGGIPGSDIEDGVIPDPEDLIDDTAGDGDTDKVWSADKTAGELSTLNSAINAKYEKPSGGIPASDLASGVIPTVHNIPSGGLSGQVLRKTSGTDYAVAWENVPAATDAQVAAAVTEWLDENVPQGQTLVVDNTLSISGAAADAKLTGEIKKAVETVDGATILSFESGGMYVASGIEYDDATRSRTKFIPVTPGTTAKLYFNVTDVSTARVFEFASNTKSASGVNERLKDNVVSSGGSVTFTSSTNYVRVQINVAKSNIVNPVILLSNGIMQDYAKSVGFPANGTIANNTDLDTVKTTGMWIINSANTYTHSPLGNGRGGVLLVFKQNSNNIIQIAGKTNTGEIYIRSSQLGSFPSEWGTNGITINNSYTFPEYSEELTVNASPEITADTNNYLASTGDTTDRTADILAMLGSNSVCHLGPGVFYVSNLQMPAKSSLIGCGFDTILQMSGSSDGFAVKMNSYTTVQNLCIRGASSRPTFSSTIGGRHAILWQGNYTASEQETESPYRGIVANVYIYNFTGGGITCYDTGYGTSNHLSVTNVDIWNCWAGINVSYWSEYHKFTNVRCSRCYVGCVNNGGNNVFVNCDFSSSDEIAFLMDNSQGQSPNNSHGSAVGCMFNHTSSGGNLNSGIGIKVLNCINGFSFEGCQIFYSQIYLEESAGIVVSGCTCGSNNCNITIKDGGTVIFANNTFTNKPTITVTDNSNVHFVNNYVRTTGAVVEPS